MPATPEELKSARRAYNWTVFWFCLICAAVIGGGLLWAKNAEDNKEPVGCTYFPGPDGEYGTADDTATSMFPGEECTP